jgi:glycosyltransferase involved in cell wall biosynthesis
MTSVLFIGKRFNTNRDALAERFGRIWQLPWHWAAAGIPIRLWLVDYHSREVVRSREGALEIRSLPALGGAALRELLASARARPAPAVVVASGDCYIGLLGLALARWLGARFVFDVYDKYDEFGGYLALPGFAPFPFLLQRADVRLFASQGLLSELGRPGTDWLVPNGVDVSRFHARDMAACRREAGLPGNRIFVGYFGGMEPDRGVDDLVAAVALLRREGLDLELLLGGKPPAGFDTSREGIRFLGNVPFAQMPVMLGCCDLLAVPYRRSTFMDAGASNKIAEAIACGRPLVATRTPNLLQNFPAQASVLAPVLATPGDAVDIARAIRAQLQQRLLVDPPRGMDWPAIAAGCASHLGLHRAISPASST